jgi:hypothetical protein
MAPSVNDWKARMKKWERGINPATETKDNVKEYVETKLYQYTLKKTTDHNL